MYRENSIIGKTDAKINEKLFDLVNDDVIATPCNFDFRRKVTMKSMAN